MRLYLIRHGETALNVKGCYYGRTDAVLSEKGISPVSYTHLDMAELADALDLGSSSSECRFDSCYPHSKSRRAAILVGFRLLFLGSGNKMVIFYL